MADESSFPAGFFERQDETDDAQFYAMPRFVVHIDDATHAALLSVLDDARGARLDASAGSGA